MKKIDVPLIAVGALLTGNLIADTVPLQAMLQKPSSVFESPLLDGLPEPVTTNQKVRLVGGASLASAGAGLGVGELIAAAILRRKRASESGLQAV